MKRKVLQVAAALLLACSMTSCYSTSTIVGSLDQNTPMVEVNTVHNHFLLYGLVGVSNHQLQDSAYVGDIKEYKVKKSITFVDGLLQWLTFGIYTPTTTTYYVPFNSKK